MAVEMAVFCCGRRAVLLLFWMVIIVVVRAVLIARVELASTKESVTTGLSPLADREMKTQEASENRVALERKDEGSTHGNKTIVGNIAVKRKSRTRSGKIPNGGAISGERRIGDFKRIMVGLKWAYKQFPDSKNISAKIAGDIGCGSMEEREIMKLARVLPVVDKDIDVVALTPPKSTSLLSTSAQDDKAHELVNCKPLESIEAAVTTEAHENARRTSGRTHEEVQYVRLEQYDYDEVKGIAVIFRNAIVTGAESLVTDCSVVYRPGGGSNFETGAGWNIYRPLTAESPHFNWTSKVDIDRAVLLASFYAYGYFHYIVECLPRVVMVRDFVLRNPDVKIIHYPPVAADLVLLYQLLGIDPARVVEYDTKTLYRANTLIVPTATATFRANTLAVQQTRDLFRDSIPGQLGIPREDPFERARLFLSSSSPGGLIRADRVRIVVHDRGRGKPRSVEQQKELESAILKRFPNAEVTVYNAARANTREMIVMHYRADVVVGPHGAGLSNALFMRRGSSMLEFNIPDRRTDPSIRCHEITATKLGLRYFYESAVGGKHSGVMQINVDDIVAALVPIVDFHENELNSSVHLTK